jgi:hypothetical protein
VKTSSFWRAEALAAADQVVVLTCPAEALERFRNMTGILAELHLARSGWYTFKRANRGGTEERIFVEVRP